MEAILATVKETAAKGKILLAGAGAESTAETIERTKRAAEFGYDAALVKTPYYYKPAYKPEALIAHYRRVADESPIPVMLYSIPQFTGIALAEKCAALFELFRQGHHERARELQSILARASKLIVSELSIAGVKYAMDQRGYRGGIPRLPLLPLHAEQKKRLTEFLLNLEPAAVRA